MSKLLLLLAAALLANCRGQEPPGPDVAARIDGEDVPYERFEAYLARTVGDPGANLASDVLSKLFDQFLDEELLARLAADRGLVRGAGPGVEARQARRTRRAIDALLAQGEAGDADETAELERYYADHQDELARPERVRLRQILVEDRATADRARAEIERGADFGVVARRLSRDAGGRGGYQGELAREELPPAFADEVFALRDGEVSRVLPAEYGFHIFQVVEHLPAEVPPLEEVAAEIRARLNQRRADQRLAALLAECRKRYAVSVYGRNLPFNYQGTYSEPNRNR